MGKPCESITECSRVPQLSEQHYCRDSTAFSNRLAGLPHNKEASRVVSFVYLCLSLPTKPATISNVWCLEICAGTLFLMLLKFGAVLSIICGFLMAIYTWTHLLQCIVVVRSFLRMSKLRKLVVRKLYLSRGGSYSVSRCIRTWIKLTPEYPFNLHLIRS